jgi:hypothetical protein
MLQQAAEAGALIDGAKAETVLGRRAVPADVPGLPDYVTPDNNAALHNSLHGLWWALEYLPHQDPHRGGGWCLPMGRRRTIPPNSLIHESVLSSRWRPMDLPPHGVEPWVAF